MRALTLYQPWASAIIAGKKRVENRPWAPPEWAIGQDIAIHAGKTYDKDGEEFLRSKGVEVLPEWKISGMVLGVVRVSGWIERGSIYVRRNGEKTFRVGTSRGTFRKIKDDPQACEILADPMFFGPFGWILDDIRKLPTPLAAKGALSLWKLQPVVEMEITATLSEQQEKKGTIAHG